MIAITSGVNDMQAVLNLVWDKLLPAFQPTPLARDDEARGNLEHALKRLSLPPETGATNPTKFAHRKYAFPANNQNLDSIMIRPGKNDGTEILVARIAGMDRQIVCGSDNWLKGRAAWSRLPDQPAAATGAWTGEDVFTAKICFYETPFTLTVRLKFTGAEVSCACKWNVGFGSIRNQNLVGKAE